MENLETLFQMVRQINDKFKDRETFNAFKTIGFINQERMHSNFIAEMLNPRGKHGMHNKFLELFLKQVPIKNECFDTANAAVVVEQRADSRWMDIFISNGKKEIIVIENKIYAGDQNRQLEDYYNFCRKKNNQVEMIYLTPVGKKPTSKSVGPVLQMEDIICISYEKHILAWIHACLELSALPGFSPRLKCTLEMYSELLYTLINKNKIMNAIFEELKKNKDYLKLAFDIKSSMEGRNFLLEFPEIKSLLKNVLLNFDEEIIFESYPAKNNDVDFQFIEGGEWWSLRFEDNEVYFTNDNDENRIEKPLFDTPDYNNSLLQALLMEDIDKINDILYRELSALKQISLSLQN
jgi:hypothetical protein